MYNDYDDEENKDVILPIGPFRGLNSDKLNELYE